ncbi:TetR/AcrR family transcriptional regulator [Microbulbifer sp. TYP-18]|uniref:TetR/AcrR family transcriptional regulator n=1 Tax=Microbulbifer sp. TYP-18 TaxID=3230024 RepID=UPI0034C64098
MVVQSKGRVAARRPAGAGSQTLISALVAAGELIDPDSPRGRLLNAAARLFDQKGYARTTVRDIAAEVGILSGSIFHHFGNKEEILSCVMQQVTVYARARMAQAVEAAASPRERLRACILSELEAIHGLAVPGFSILVLEWRSLSSQNQKKVLRLREDYERIWHGAIAAAKGPQSDAALIRRLLQGALMHTYNWFKPSAKGMSLQQLADEVLNVFSPQ